MTSLCIFFIQLSTIIHWHENNQLTWDDFLGPVNTTEFYDAQSFTGFKYSYEGEYDDSSLTLTVIVFTTFDTEKSWVRKDKKTKKLLQHEQLHFDITELVSRQIRKEMIEKKFTKNFQDEINEIHKKYERIRADLQNEYDSATDHSMIAEEQTKWEKEIAKKLKKLDDFSATKFTIKVDL